MITDKKEIESVLQIGEKILLDHPELYNMSLDEVLVAIPQNKIWGIQLKRHRYKAIKNYWKSSKIHCSRDI